MSKWSMDAESDARLPGTHHTIELLVQDVKCSCIKKGTMQTRASLALQTLFLKRGPPHTLRRGGQKEYKLASFSSVRKSKRARRDANKSASGFYSSEGTLDRSHPGSSGVFLLRQHLEDIHGTTKATRIKLK